MKLSFKSSSVEIKVGEYALIQDGDNVDNYFCCRVRELYENDNREKMAKVTWFLTVDNYHKSIRRHKEADKLRIKDYYGKSLNQFLPNLKGHFPFLLVIFSLV